MARYIDADELINQILPDPILECGRPEPEGIEELTFWLDMAETKDAVEVVRCEDCKWYQNGKYLTEQMYCYRLLDDNGNPVGYMFPPDGFCSFGERK